MSRMSRDELAEDGTILNGLAAALSAIVCGEGRYAIPHEEYQQALAVLRAAKEGNHA